MRMMPASYPRLRNPRGSPTRTKKPPVGKVAHLVAPLKGLSHFAQLNETDPLLASILTNWIVEQDRITVRPGYNQIGSISTGSPISTLIPWQSDTQKFVAAADGKLYRPDSTVLAAGPFGSDNWAWTMFSNLSAIDYTIMVNGVDGVKSWDGTTVATEAVTAPAGEAWVNPAKFDKIYAHMNRLWFADSENMAVYYLPVQQKSGAVFLMPLNAIFRRGGHIVALHSWSMDGGAGMDDSLVIFTSNGECAIYSGVDPASDWKLTGVFRFDSPMSKSSIINFGGDLYVLISTGFVPMTTLLRAESEQLGKSDLGVMADFEEVAIAHRDDYGWGVILNSHSNHAICNMPLGAGKYQQMVRMMPGQVWAKWDIPARCWLWFDNKAYFATENGKIYQMGPQYLNDNGAAINADVRFSWSNYKSLTKKNFKLVKPYVITDGQPRPFIDMDVDYGNNPPTNLPDITSGASGGADWGTSAWDASDWALLTQPRQNWQGVTGLGRVGAPRLRVSVTGCSFSLTGLDVIYEPGGLM